MTYLKLNLYQGNDRLGCIDGHLPYWRNYYQEGGVMLDGGLVFKSKGEHTEIFLNNKLLAEIKKPLAEVEALILEAKAAGVAELDWRDISVGNKDEEERIAPIEKKWQEMKAARAAKIKKTLRFAAGACGGVLCAATLVGIGYFFGSGGKQPEQKAEQKDGPRSSLGSLEGLPTFMMSAPREYDSGPRVEFFAELPGKSGVVKAWENVTGPETRKYMSWQESNPEGAFYSEESGWRNDSGSLDDLDEQPNWLHDAWNLQSAYKEIVEQVKGQGFKEGQIYCLKGQYQRAMDCTIKPPGAKHPKIGT